MAVDATNAAQRLAAANACAKVEALLRRAVQEGPVNYALDIDVAVNDAIIKLGIVADAV